MDDLKEKLNKMTPEEVLKMVDENPDMNLLVPAKEFRFPLNSFTNEFNDEFKNPNGPWVQEITEKYSLMVDFGKYHFYHNEKDTSQISYVPIGVDSKSNWGWEAKIEFLEGNNDCQFGLLLGQNENGNGSYFIINSEKQTYTIADQAKGEWTIFKNDEVSLSIHPKTNLLRAERVNGKVRYFINDYYIGERPLKNVEGNLFGFSVFGKAKIAIESVKIHW